MTNDHRGGFDLDVVGDSFEKRPFGDDLVAALGSPPHVGVVEVVSEDRALLVFDDEVLRERLRGGDAGVLGSGFLRPVSHRGHLRFTLVILTPPGAVEGEY